jgi:ActR/RegA family two-component response regulator
MPNDGIDFGQAVIATAYASIATLDKHWKRRVETILPKPNKLAHIYYRPELDKMVRDIERFLDNASLERGRALSSSS